MNANQHSSFNIVKSDFIYHLLNEDFRPNDINNKFFLFAYYDIRKCQIWSASELKELRGLFAKCADKVVVKIEEIEFAVRDVNRVLKLKSALMFLSEDFPEFSESILYSPAMMQLDEIFDSWNMDEPPFGCVGDFISLRRDWKTWSVNNHCHSWWKIFDTAEFVCGVPIRTVLIEGSRHYIGYLQRVYDIAEQHHIKKASTALRKAEHELLLVRDEIEGPTMMSRCKGKTTRVQERLAKAITNVEQAKADFEQSEEGMKEAHRRLKDAEKELAEAYRR